MRGDSLSPQLWDRSRRQLDGERSGQTRSNGRLQKSRPPRSVPRWGLCMGPEPSSSGPCCASAVALAQERKDALRGLVGLREHARAGLLKDVELGELGHLGGHVHVADAALGSGQVLLVRGQVRRRCSRRFWTAPKSARTVEIFLIALSTLASVIAARAVPAAAPSAASARASTSAPPVPVMMFLVVTVMVSLSLAPTWNLTSGWCRRHESASPSSSAMPLNLVLSWISGSRWRAA